MFGVGLACGAGQVVFLWMAGMAPTSVYIAVPVALRTTIMPHIDKTTMWRSEIYENQGVANA
jgi:hypothetical protein